MGTLSVAAVVVNLDGGPLLDACLDSLASQGAAETVVVDNGSAPSEVARLKERPEVTLLTLPENRGFALPANLGMAGAGRRSGVPPDYLAIVNNDCALGPGYLAACAEVLEADPKLAAAQGVVLDARGERIDGCGIGWNGRAEAIQIGRGELPPPPDAPPFAVPGVSATAALYRRDAFLSAGGFEETFFAYYEDADLSLRLSRGGWRFACVPAARARHVGSATGRRAPMARWRRLFENRIRTLRRNLTPEAAAALLHGPIGRSAVRSAAREIGWGRALWTALAASSGTPSESRRDLEILSALPPLTKLPS